MKRKRKKSLTLLEIMIVIFLIGLISGVIGYNMKGSLDKGRAFKSEEGASHLRDLLLLEVANGRSAQEVVEDPAKFLAASGLVNNPQKMIKDGWGQLYAIEATDDNDITITSTQLEKYKAKRKMTLGDSSTEDNE